MIRRARAKDLEQIRDLLLQVLQVHAEGRPDIFVAGTRKYTDDELLELFLEDSRPIFVYTDENDRAVGHAFCVLRETRGIQNMQDMRSLYIDDICVDEAHRGQHIASALYEYVREYAKGIGCYNIMLNVWEKNPGARRFYEAMGMSVMKTTMEDIL